MSKKSELVKILLELKDTTDADDSINEKINKLIIEIIEWEDAKSNPIYIPYTPVYPVYPSPDPVTPWRPYQPWQPTWTCGTGTATTTWEKGVTLNSPGSPLYAYGVGDYCFPS